MDQERALRGLAGSFVVISIVLSHYYSPWWLLFTLFVGLNLFQSAFSGWCPMMSFLSAVGIRKNAVGTSRGGD